jgi:hypothetical protein
MTTYKYFRRVIKTGKNKDSGEGWCGVVEGKDVTDVYGLNVPYSSEDELIADIASRLEVFKFLIYMGRVSAQPETISLEAEYLV